MRIALLVVAVLLGAAAPSSAALRVVDDGRAVGPGTDGRFVAWATGVAFGAPVRLLDTTTGRRRTVPSPAGCTFAAIGAGTLLWNCGTAPGSSGRTLDLRTGETGLLGAIPIDPRSMIDSARYVGVGRFWVRLERGGYHTLSTSYASRATGAEHGVPRADDLVADLGRPGLYRRLCAPVRRPEVAAELGTALAPELAQRDGVSVSTVTTDSGTPSARVVLQRCGRPARTLRRCPLGACSTVDQPAVVAGSAVWTESRTRGARRTASLRILALRTGRTRVVPLGADARLVGAAGRRVFLRSGRELKHVTL